MDGDVLRFTVMDKDTFPNPDDFLGKAELTAQDFYPNGFHGELMLVDSKTQATLTVMVVIAGCDEAAEGGAGESVEGTMVAGSSSAAVYAADGGDGSTMMGNSSPVMYSAATASPAGVAMQGSPFYSSGVPTTAAPMSQSMTYSAPQTYSVPMSGMVTTSVMGSQPMTYAAPVPSESVAATGKVIVHPPVTVTAEEFARIDGTIVSEPLPVTVNQEVVVNNIEATDKSVKIKKKKKSKSCC